MVLLTLLHLGPTLPAFLSPKVASVLSRSFGIAGMSDVDQDLKLFALA